MSVWEQHLRQHHKGTSIVLTQQAERQGSDWRQTASSGTSAMFFANLARLGHYVYAQNMQNLQICKHKIHMQFSSCYLAMEVSD